MKLKKLSKYQNVYSYESKKCTLYAVRFIYYDLTGKRREKQQRGFKTAILAHKAELQLEINYANNDIQQIVDSTMTVSQWIEHFKALNKSHWRPNTRENYLNSFKKYIIPLIGNQQLDKLTRLKYQRLFIEPLLERLAPETVVNHHRIMMALINSAVENDVLIKNSFKCIKIPRGERRQAFSKKDLVKFNNYLPKLNPEFHTIFTLLELTGMRLGESLALTWKDIDFAKNIIKITKTRGVLGTGPTKTAAGTRSITMTASLVKLLKHYQIVQKEMCLRSQLSFHYDHLIFTSAGRNVPASTATVDYNFRKVLKQAGITSKYVVHSLRHTHATYLLNSGINPVDVARRLGHSSANVTLAIYAHSLDGSDREIALKIDKIVGL